MLRSREFSGDYLTSHQKDLFYMEEKGAVLSFHSIELLRLQLSMQSQAFGTIKDRFKSLLGNRSLISNKYWLQLSSLCRNYAGLEKCWKYRNILIVNLYLQQTLVLLHDIVFKCLEKLGVDLTYDQNKILQFLHKNKNKKLVSLDLTDATTQQHTSIIETLLSYCISPEFGRCFVQIVKEELNVHFNNNGSIFSLFYTSGTAQGTRSIWGLFVIAHHMLIQKAFRLCGIRDLEYCILGDNIVFVDNNYDPSAQVDQQSKGSVTYEYIRLSAIFGGTFDHKKSWYPTKISNSIEFAKRYIMFGSDITPFALNFLLRYENTSPKDLNMKYSALISGLCDFLVLHLLPRFGFGADTRAIIKGIKFCLLMEVGFFDTYISFKGHKVLGYIFCFLLEKYSFKGGRWSPLRTGIQKLLCTFNSIMVSEFGYNSYFPQKFYIISLMLHSQLDTTKLMLEKSLPFKYSQLPEVFYLNYINLKTHLQMRSADKKKTIDIPDLPSDIRNSIFSTLQAYQNHPLVNLCLFVEAELSVIHESLEKMHILIHALCVTLDIKYLAPLMEISLKTSRYTETKSDFGLARKKGDKNELHKNHPLQEFHYEMVKNVQYSVQFSGNLVNLRASTWNWIISNKNLQLMDMSSTTKIISMANILCTDFYPFLKNLPPLPSGK
jgi:hypothetical protein